jgi:ABC-type sugar transport system substrate-binding protein
VGSPLPEAVTALATAEDRHAGIASGVNDAVARAASLIAVAACRSSPACPALATAMPKR